MCLPYFFFLNVYTQNTLKGMRIVLFIADKYDIVHHIHIAAKSIVTNILIKLIFSKKYM